MFLVARSEVQRLNSLLPLESRCHEFSCVAQRHKILSPPYCNLWSRSLCFVTHFHRTIQDWQMFATLAAKPCDCEGIEDLCYWSILKRRSQLQPRQVRRSGNHSLKFSEGAVDSSWAVEALVQNLEKNPFAWCSFGATFHPCYQTLVEPIPTEMGIILVGEPADPGTVCFLFLAVRHFLTTFWREEDVI